MITVIDDYVITSDAYGYTLVRNTGRIDKKTKTLVLKPISYHGSVRQALESCRRDYIRRGLQEGDMTLSEAVSRMRDMDNTFKEVLERCIVE